MAYPPQPQLNKERHIKYWKRCAQLLPEPYMTGESSRMSFGFFIVAALDLLGSLETAIALEERQSWIEWIYACQVPHTGGFRGFPGTALGALRSPHNWHWDPANLPNTYFALATLLILGDDLARVRRRECLAWVTRLQHPDGSFGEFLGEDDVVQGGRDPRLCMCAAGTVRILMRNSDDEQGAAVGIDQLRLQQYLANCQSLEGGIAEAPLLEAHSGLNYCAIATLSFLSQSQKQQTSIQELVGHTGFDLVGCARWMLERQTTWIEEEDADDDDEDDEGDDDKNEEKQSDAEAKPDSPERDVIAGFCGRSGKIADTCYCFWNVGALKILNNEHFVEVDALRRYLLQTVAHIIGGFGKGPGELPDLLHSYLGLAVLAIYKEPGLKEFDATFCFSMDAVQNLKRVAWTR